MEGSETVSPSQQRKVRPEGAEHQWRKMPSKELSVDLVANKRGGRVPQSLAERLGSYSTLWPEPIAATYHLYRCKGVWIPPTINSVQRNTSNNANPMKVAAASDIAAAPMAFAAAATSFMVFPPCS